MTATLLTARRGQSLWRKRESRWLSSSGRGCRAKKAPATNTGRDQDDPREGSFYAQHHGEGGYFVLAQSLSYSPLVSLKSIFFWQDQLKTVCRAFIKYRVRSARQAWQMAPHGKR